MSDKLCYILCHERVREGEIDVCQMLFSCPESHPEFSFNDKAGIVRQITPTKSLHVLMTRLNYNRVCLRGVKTFESYNTIVVKMKN